MSPDGRPPTWKRAVAEELASNYQRGKQFTLSDFYRRSEARLQSMYPNNTTVQATIRQILQQLRDDGQVRFDDGNGTYTYLAGQSVPPKRTEVGERLAALAYELARRITRETGRPATDYLVVARDSRPEQALATLIAKTTSATFVDLYRAGRLDLTFESALVEVGSDYGISGTLVAAARDRLDYYESEADG